MMEEKLIIGGEVISRASKQEGLLRKAEQELRERQQQETRLARELAEKEEANLQLEGSVCFAFHDCNVLYNLAYVLFLTMTDLCGTVLYILMYMSTLYKCNSIHSQSSRSTYIIIMVISFPMTYRAFFKSARRGGSENKEVEEALGQVPRCCEGSAGPTGGIPSTLID